MRLSARALAAASLLMAAACDDGAPECAAGELRYAGRPPRHLFAYDHTCREDCFSEPTRKNCDERCEPVRIEEAPGLLESDRRLVLVDPTSLGGGRALAYSFGYVDEAGGSAPERWSFLAKKRSYVSDEVEGTARFTMHAAVVETAPACTGGCAGAGICVDEGYCASACVPADPDPCGPGRLCGDNGAGQFACRFAAPSVSLGSVFIAAAPTGELAPVTPGRLEITAASETRIAGELYLGWETPTDKPQGQVNGCFDLTLGAPVVDADGTARRRLSP